MIKIKRFMMLFVVCCFTSLFMIPDGSVKAAELVPTALDNLRVGLKSLSELVATDDGYMRVFYDGEKIGIEYYDDSFQIKSKTSLPMRLLMRKKTEFLIKLRNPESRNLQLQNLKPQNLQPQCLKQKIYPHVQS